MLQKKSLKGNFSITLSDILLATGGRILKKGTHTTFFGISTDSRTCEGGEIFVPLLGRNFDGHDFIKDAGKRGAFGCLVESRKVDRLSDLKDLDMTVVEVFDTLKALGDISSFWIRKFDIPIFGITGSCGKTTTKELLSSILEKKFRTKKTEGNENNLLGLPLNILEVDTSIDVFVAEMGTNKKGEIERLSEILNPNFGAITNILPAHLEGFGGLDVILDEKMKLFEYVRDRGGRVAVNLDDPLISKSKILKDIPNFTFGFTEDSDVFAKEIVLDEKRSRFKLSIFGDEISVELNIPGKFNIKNALCAVCLASFLEVDKMDIKEGLESFFGCEGRMNIEDLFGITIIDDTYNANPSSMKRALEHLSIMKCKRRICVLGDMAELGYYANTAHIELGREVKRANVDILYFIGKYGDLVVKSASLSGVFARAFKSKKEILQSLLREVEKGDCVLFKGSRCMELDKLVSEFKSRYKS